MCATHVLMIQWLELNTQQCELSLCTVWTVSVHCVNCLCAQCELSLCTVWTVSVHSVNCLCALCELSLCTVWTVSVHCVNCLCALCELSLYWNRAWSWTLLTDLTHTLQIFYLWFWIHVIFIFLSPGSSVSIVSDYGLDDRAIGVRSRRGQRIFPLLCVQTGSGAYPASYTMGTGVLSPRVKSGRGVTLITHPHLVPRSSMSRSYTTSPPNRLHGV
jgi:hypothetical protein